MRRKHKNSTDRAIHRWTALGRTWTRVGLDIRDRTLELVDTGLQATTEAVDHSAAARGERGIEGRVSPWTGAASTWASVGIEIGRVAVEAAAGGLRQTARTLEDARDDDTDGTDEADGTTPDGTTDDATDDANRR